MDELQYLDPDQLLAQKISECCNTLEKLAMAMDETNETLKELLKHLKKNKST